MSQPPSDDQLHAAGGLGRTASCPRHLQRVGGSGGAGRIRLDHGTLNGNDFGSPGALAALGTSRAPAVDFSAAAP